MLTLLSALGSLLSFRLRSRASLELELVALRHQVTVLHRQRPGQPRLFSTDRLLWVWLYRIWPQVLNTMVLVKPATVVQWHRKGFRLYWRRRSRHLGRRRVSREIRDLIRQMGRANPLWGAPRIHGELLKLGFDVSQATVGRYLPWRSKAPSSTWRSFLHNHMHEIAAVDMFVVVTARFQLLYALLVLGHERRKVVHFDVTRTRHKVGWRAKSLRPSLGTPRLAFCCETETLRMGRPSAIVSRRWRSRRSSPRRDRHGRMPTSSASSARSAANVSITSSSSTSVTCAVCCRHTLSITTEAERISRSAKIVRSLGPYSHPLLALLSPFQRSAACTIATSVAQPEWFAVAEPAQPSRCRGSSRPAISSREWHSIPNRCPGLRSPQRSTLWVE